MVRHNISADINKRVDAAKAVFVNAFVKRDALEGIRDRIRDAVVAFDDSLKRFDCRLHARNFTLTGLAADGHHPLAL